jgi:pimeloyl-ACP methyl ester carboxylesterase
MKTSQFDQPIRTEFVDANGLRFEVDKCGAGDKLAICLHGFPENSFSWRYQLPMLADAGYEAWAPNMRGYGGSSRPALVEDYHIDRLMDDVAALIDASGHENVVLIGHDWGAMYRTRDRHKEQCAVGSLSCVGPGTYYSSRFRGCRSFYWVSMMRRQLAMRCGTPALMNRCFRPRLERSTGRTLIYQAH